MNFNLLPDEKPIFCTCFKEIYSNEYYYVITTNKQRKIVWSEDDCKLEDLPIELQNAIEECDLIEL